MSARPETNRGHRPVLLKEVLDALAPRDGAIYVDGTFGAGGYSTAILAAADCQIWGVDRDAGAAARGRLLADSYDGRLHIVEGRFGDMGELLADKASFVGMGHMFRIWEPGRLAAHKSSARQRANQENLVVPPSDSPPGGGGR
jgi:hypothetical protein